MESSLYHICNDCIYNYDEQMYTEICNKNFLLFESLKSYKNKIDNQRNWDIAKKYANTYEFIFSFNNDGVADIVPISRSYFKLIEILKDNLIFISNPDIKAACLCEGPGGFVQAINDFYKNQNLHPIDCITLISNDKRVPHWKLKNITNYKICYGEDNTGNLYNIRNIDFFVKTVGKNMCDLVTADGGFDFSKNFNAQETDFLLLLLCEIYVSLLIQKEGGSFIVKVFDLFNTNTINMIALLRMNYEKVTIQKPKTSRPANSEKYLICSNFKSNSISENLLENIKTNIINGSFVIDDIIPLDLKFDTLIHVYKYNVEFVNHQTQSIIKTLNVLTNLNKTINMRNNIAKCIEWCVQYNIPIKPGLV